MHTEQPPDNDGFRQVIENKIVWWVIFYSRCNNLKLRRNQISMLSFINLFARGIPRFYQRKMH